MADKLLLCVSSTRATAARWRGGKLALCEVFANDEEGLAAFAEYLKTAKGAPAYIAVDAVEEDYRIDTLPHAYGADRVELVERKLKQHYRNAPYVAATLQGRDTGKRRDDRYLFSALTNAELVNGWLQAIQAQGLPVAGIYLLPTICAGLVEKLQLKSASQLIVSQQSGGLRLTYFRDGQFRLSRLSRSDTARAATPAQAYAEEISNTRLYLHALRATTLDEHLALLLVDRNNAFDEVAQTIARDSPGIECTRIDAGEIATRLGMNPAVLAVSPDALFLQLLGQKAPTANLAPAKVTTGFQQYQSRRAIHLASTVAAAAGIAWIGYNLWQVYDLKDQTADAARQTATQQAQYQEATRQFPAAPTTAENLKRTVEIAQKLRADRRTPEKLMQIVAAALEPSPDIVVRELGWKYGRTDIESTGAPADPRAAAAAAPPAPTPLPGAPAASAPRRQTALIEGEIRPFRGDHRAAIDAINSLAERLRRDPAVQDVRVDKLPLNVNPGLQLSGNTLDSRTEGATAEFRLFIALRPGT